MLTELFRHKATAVSVAKEQIQDDFSVTAELITEKTKTLQNVIAGMTKPSEDAVRITTEMDRTFLAYISRAINHVISVSDIFKQSKQVNSNIDSLDSLIEKQAAAVDQASLAIEQMTVNISSVTNILGENNKVMDALLVASGEGTSGILRVTEIMKTLVSNSEVLQDASKMIQSIAAQTNLLAMNAAIEAAHAGQYGQGFAVVASEIRKLAENCSSQGKSISKILKELQKEISDATGLTGKSQDEFEEIASLVDRARQQEQTIRQAMNEHQTGNAQVLQATHQIQEVTHAVRDGAEKITKSTSLIPVSVSELEAETAEMSKAINDLMGDIEDVEVITQRFHVDVSTASDIINQIQKSIDN
jgi:methyl-accepting chemotaxis protein